MCTQVILDIGRTGRITYHCRLDLIVKLEFIKVIFKAKAETLRQRIFDTSAEHVTTDKLPKAKPPLPDSAHK